MANTISIKGVPPYDGDYPIELERITNRELSTIKRLSGVRGAELSDAFAAGDNDLFVALTIIALQRAGKIVAEDAIWDAESGSITFSLGPVEEEVPESGPPSPPPTDPGANVTGGDMNGSSGADSEPTGALNPEIPTATGSQV